MHRKKYWKIQNLFSLKKKRSSKAPFIFASRLAWQAVLKKTTVKLELLTDVNMLLMVEKGIRGVTCYAICQYVKVTNT